jgi:hypothetical protein
MDQLSLTALLKTHARLHIRQGSHRYGFAQTRIVTGPKSPDSDLNGQIPTLHSVPSPHTARIPLRC